MTTTEHIEKIQATVLYVASKLEGLTIYQLNKILYFADQKHLVKYGRPVIEESYIKLEYGPVPHTVYNGFTALQGKNTNFIDVFEGKLKADKKLILPLEMPDMDELSGSDIECLNASIEENRSLNFGQLKDKSHKLAWDNADFYSPMSILDIAKEAGADEGLLNYINIYK